MRKPVLKVRKYSHSATHPFLLDLRGFGQGRKFFRTRAAAEEELYRIKRAVEHHGQRAVGLSQRVLAEFLAAYDKLAPFGATIGQAADFLVHHLEKVRRCKTTVVELAQEVLDAKSRDGMSDAYLNDLRKRLDRFCQGFGNRPIAGITVEELDNWFRNLPLSPKSKANYRANVGVLFSEAERRGMIDRNPVLRTAKPKLIDKPPEIFSVNELLALLETAARSDVLPMLAIGAFAGLRDAEIKRLDWREVDLARGHIEITAAKAKSARRRIVPIQSNLAAWLRPYSGMAGRVVPEGHRAKLNRVRKAAGLARWPNNGLRHSFASYRLAATADAPRVAAELGHTSPQMLYSTYREIVLPVEADRYWKITPAETANVVAFESRKTAE